MLKFYFFFNLKSKLKNLHANISKHFFNFKDAKNNKLYIYYQCYRSENLKLFFDNLSVFPKKKTKLCTIHSFTKNNFIKTLESFFVKKLRAN